MWPYQANKEQMMKTKSLNLDDIVDDIVKERSFNTDPKDEVGRQRNIKQARKVAPGIQGIRAFLNQVPKE